MQAIDRNKIPVARLAIILGALATFAAFGTDTYLSGFPNIAKYYNTSMANVQLSLSVYFFGLAVGQMIYGPLVDRYGRRRPLLAGLTLFILASVLIVVAPNVHCFVLLRLAQALGGCSGMIVGRAVVSDIFDLRGSANFLSMLAVVQGLAPIIAPTVGSFLLAFAPWQSVFIFLTVFGLACFFSSAFGLPETLPPEKRRNIGIGTTLRDYASLFAQRNFIVPALAGGIASSCMFAYIAGSPFVFMTLFGRTSGQYGMIFACIAVSTVVAAQVNRMLLKRTSPQKIFNGTLKFNIAVIAILIAMVAIRAPMWAFMIPLWFCVGSMPLIMANGMALAMATAREKAGSASAVVGLLQFGMASVSSTVVSLLDNGTAYPMVGVMMGVVIVGLIVNLFTPKMRDEDLAL